MVKIIYIYKTPHAFEPDEFIFGLERENFEPTLEISEADQSRCFACKTPLKKPVKCEFCAMQFCVECRNR